MFGIKQKTEAQTLKSGKIKIYEERFNVFILAALLLLLVEELLEDKCRPAARKRFGFLVWLVVCSLLPLLLPHTSLAADPPDDAERNFVLNANGRGVDLRSKIIRGNLGCHGCPLAVDDVVRVIFTTRLEVDG